MTSALELLFSCTLITHNIPWFNSWVAEAKGCSFLPKEITAVESPNWALNPEPCDYQADALSILTSTAELQFEMVW